MVFERQIATALRLIKRNGKAVTWRQRTSTVPDPNKPWEVVDDDTITDHADIPIVFLPYNQANRAFIANIVGTEVPAGRNFGLMGAQSFTPGKTDVVVDGAKEIAIQAIDVLSPNGEIILYTLFFRD